ncbi:MAG: peptidyl-prolyl cis-trans isomerase [Acidobacteriota bacterium]|nr:peptidyl-prolyl cis-trans isomerase [Acidobacteriota bacterium]
MFDLFRSRDKMVRIMLGGLLGIVALSMLLYLIPGNNGPTGSRKDTVVAEIGGVPMTVVEVQRQIQSVLKNKQFPAEMIQVYIPQLVDEMVAERAIGYEAHRLGFEISDSELADMIRGMPQIGSLPPAEYRQAVEQMTGASVAEFENNLRKRAYFMVLNNLAVESSVVAPADVEKEFARRYDKVKLDYIAFEPDKLKGELKPSGDELKQYFERNRSFFPLPESRSFQMVIADQAKVAESIQVPDAQTLQFYNANKDRFRTAERVQMRHILLSTAGKTPDEVKKIKTQAEDVLKQAKNGGDFAKLAEKYSADPGSAGKGGDLGWVVRGQMVKEFEEAAFSLPVNQISSLVTTNYGFHILQVLAKEPAHLRTYEEVKPEIAGEIRRQAVNDRMQQLADQARAELVKAPRNAGQIASKLGLSVVTVDKYTAGETIPELGNDPQVGGAVGTLKAGEVSIVIQSGNKLVIVVVTGITPKHDSQLAEVDAQVRERWSFERASQLAQEKARKAAALLAQNGGDLQAAAKAVGGEVKSTDDFSRQGAAQGIGSASYVLDAFTKPVGSILGPVNVGNQVIVAKVMTKTPADMTKLAAERDAVVSQLKAKKADERFSLLQDSIVSRLIQEGKVKINRPVLDRIVQQYKNI